MGEEDLGQVGSQHTDLGAVPDIGFAEESIPNKRSDDPNMARVIAASARVLSEGATFHSDDGIYSRLFGPTTKACALAFFSGL